MKSPAKAQSRRVFHWVREARCAFGRRRHRFGRVVCQGTRGARRVALCLCSLVVACAAVFGCRPQPAEPETRPDASQPERIISMAPSITETLFAIGVGERVVGVTRYCEYPPEATELPKVGGYLNPSYEAVLALEPDLVIVPEGAQSPGEALNRLDVPLVRVDHTSLEGVLASFDLLGERLGVPEEGRRLRQRCMRRVEEIADKVAGRPRPRVLIAVDRQLEPDHLQDVYVAADDGYLNRLCELAGGQNACRETRVAFPIVSAEGILAMNPEIIFDVVGNVAAAGQGADAQRTRKVILSGWQQVPEVDAVRHQRIYIVGDEVPVVPGPRFVELLEYMARRIHPEVDWNEPEEPSPED